MSSRISGGAALLLAASSAWPFTVGSVDSVLSEEGGVQSVTVEVQRGGNDPTTACTFDVAVAAQQVAGTFEGNATANQDFIPTTDNLIISLPDGAGAASATFDLEVLDDNLVEIQERLFAGATQASSSDCSGVFIDIASFQEVFIDSADVGNLTVAVDTSSIVVNEDAGTVDVSVSISGAASVEPDFEVFAAWSATPGTAQTPADFGGPQSGTLVFTRAEPTQVVTFPIVDDALIESTEDFALQIGTPSAFVLGEIPIPVGLGADTTTVQIADDDSPGTLAFAGEPFTVDETAGTAPITLRRVGGTAGTFTAFYRVADGTAVEGQDYSAVSGQVQWLDGDAADKVFTVPILDDAEGEEDETVLVRASTDSDFVEFEETTLTINDDEGLATTSFAASTASATEDGGEVVLTLVRGGGTAGVVTVDYATADGTAVAGEDYVAATGTVTWADGDGADKTVTIALLEDSDQEDAEDFVVNLFNVTGSASLGSNASIAVTISASDESRDIAEIPDLNPNQAALAGYLDTTCSSLGSDPQSLPPDAQDLFALCGILRDVNTDDATVRDALDAINPEELLVSTFNALQLTGVQHGNVNQRLNALRGGATGVSLTGLNLELGGQQIAGNALQEMFDNLVGGGASADEAGSGRWGAFINGRIADGDQDASENEAGFGFDLYSVTAGVDYRFKPNLIAGVSAGFGSVDADFDQDVGGMDIDSWNVGAYLTYFREESFYLDALATYGENDYESRRRVAFSGGGGAVDRIGQGKTDGRQLSLGLGSGWDFNRGGITFGPHFGGYFFDVDVDGFEETGAGGLNVAVDDQSSQSLTMNAGGHVSYAWLTDWGVLVPNAKVDWVHEFEDNRETLTFRFVNDPFAGDPGDPSPSVTLQSNRPDSDYFIWSAGVSAQFVHGFSGFVSYQSYAGYDDISLGEWSFGARWEKTY